jgi:hypothetical protein
VAQELKIDLNTGVIAATVPEESERNERTLALLEELSAEVTELEARADNEARAVLIQAYVLKTVLEEHPRNWLTDRSKRRTWNEVDERIDALVKRTTETLGEEEGEWVWSELPYIRDTLSRLHAKQKAENEVNHLILTPLGKLQHSQINYKRSSAEDLARVCQDVASSLRTSAPLDEEILAWGPENRGALLHGRELNHIPTSKLPKNAGPILMAAGAMDALVGVAALVARFALDPPPMSPTLLMGIGAVMFLSGMGAFLMGLKQSGVANAAKAALPGEFASLSQKFRERLYLICVLRTLDAFRSGYTQKLEAFRAHIKDSGGQQRWKKAKFDGRDLTEVFAPETWDPRGTVELWLAEKVKEVFRLESTKLAGPEDMDAESWAVIQQAFELESVDTGGSLTEAKLLDLVSELLFSRRGEDSASERERVFGKVRQEWQASSLAARGANA